MTDAPTLKPCPFCGRDADLVRRNDGRWERIACTECEIEGPRVYCKSDADRHELAARGWNRRHGDE